MFQIATLLTCHNRKEKTLACLQTLYSCVLPDEYKIEVFLVDDGSTDGTSQILNTKFPQVNIIQGDGNLFWNRGMNLAWQTAAKTKDYDYYLWLNDDTLLNSNAIIALLNTANIFENKSIIVGTTSSIEDVQKVTYGGRYMDGKLLFSYEKAGECNFFNGNIVLISNYIFSIVGYNDPVFHHALGDFDYGLRAKKLGVSSFVAPDILGSCDLHLSLPDWRNPEICFFKRWKAFRSPLGQNPEEFFIFEKRHAGYYKAIVHYLTNHLRVLWPRLWSLKVL